MKVLAVGTALDTNGQKHRLVEAAKRWGDDPDVLKALIVGRWDGAGIPARLKVAAEKGTGIVIRSAHRAQAYFEFPTDIVWSRATEREVFELAQEADVVHLTNDVRAYFSLRLPKLRKPGLLHHHGTLFRSLHDNGASRARLLSEAKRLHLAQAVSTIDLLRYAPDALRWLPAPLDLDAMAEMRKVHRRPDDGMVRIMSAPTRRDLKSTDLLIRAVNTLKAEGLPVELVLVESRSWAECLAVKATADIYFDQVAVPEMDYPGGYGCNAIEAWGMGIPVVAGADEWTTAKMVELFDQSGDYGIGGPIPFYTATVDTITDRLRELVTDPALRTAYGSFGRMHAERFHSEKAVMVRLAELYHEAIARQAAYVDVPFEEYPEAPGRFRTHLPKLIVPIGAHRIRFVEGETYIADPVIGRKMRETARNVAKYQIHEVLPEVDEYHRSEVAV